MKHTCVAGAVQFLLALLELRLISHRHAVFGMHILQSRDGFNRVSKSTVFLGRTAIRTKETASKTSSAGFALFTHVVGIPTL